MLNNNEIRYTIKILMNIAFPNEEFSFIDFNLVKIKNFNIEFNLMDDNDYKRLLNGKIKLKKVNNYNDKFKLPIYLNNRFVTKKDDYLFVNADIITLPFLLLSRKEELLIGQFDNHNRFLYEKSLSKMYNIIDFPIVDEYAFLLRKEINKYLKISLNVKKTNLYLTHDVDNLFRFSNFINNFKTIIGGDLINRKNFKMFFSSISEYRRYKNDSMYDPKIEAIYKLIDISKKYNLKSHFFFLCYNKGDDDYRYDIFDDRVKIIINYIKENGMYVGLHTGKNANNNLDNFVSQYNNLFKFTDFTENRNHYLMFNALNTVDILEKNNIKYDYSLGYRERIGFKCGTSYDFPLYNFKENRESSVIERPLIVMDVTLKETMKLTKENAVKSVLKLYDSVRNVNGDFTILWHPDSVIREWESWFNYVYLKIVEEINEKESNNI